MGIPKYFRYVSERYPCLSEVVREYQIPDFDNLYLDMNGIIHVCSHPNDTDPHFRISEENIFRDIFHYIESLFRMIQPQKLFFMAVDGVAPRAKMNQQRGRRFRSAKDAEIAEIEAQLKGEQLPGEERFDSNCITPGTEFMTRLQAQLKYFVTYKISTDKLWQKCKVILSGHETPGEGEHKIMDYIRYMKSQPGYDPHTRHCLYGLDADLIMLGLCTHEPNFSLLREEVKYGKKNNNKRIPTPEETTFYLLHLSLMREYLDLEFQQLKTTLIKFPYDLEHIIDDWVLMGFLVGNDFIPHLPELHINKGALPILYRCYIDILPYLDGYINEGGTLRLDRFQKYMERLATFDFERFKETIEDLRYFEAKTGRKQDEHSYMRAEDDFSPPKDKELAALIASTNQLLDGTSEEDDDDENYTDVDSDELYDDEISLAEFIAHKKNYYMEKMEYKHVTPEVLRSQSEGYVRAIQWNLNYYYNGCCSWSWFYPHHYAPFISDIQNFSNLVLEYDLGKPFLPFQQLLAVLPAASKKLLPEAYHDLMVNEDSPIFHYYPTEFKTDLNGKKQEWEALVLIPFIEQESLVQAMETKEALLTEEERSRNKHGPMHVFTYSPENLGSYLAPAYFPALANHHAHMEDVHREQISVDPSQLVKGLCPGIQNVYSPGFPTLRHISFTADIRPAKVKVFDFPSLADCITMTILPQKHLDVSEVAVELLGKSVFVNWPHMYEAKVVGVSSKQQRFKLNNQDSSIVSEDINKCLQQQWDLSRTAIEERYLHRMGIDIGETDILIYACNFEGSKYVMVSDKMQCQKQWSHKPEVYALQTTLSNVAIRNESIPQNLTLEHLFPPGTVVFVLDTKHYGSMGTVVQTTTKHRVKIDIEYDPEPNLQEAWESLMKKQPHYMTGNAIAYKLDITGLLLSRITGTVYVHYGNSGKSDKSKTFNIGLNLKFTKKNEEVSGYSRKNNGSWFYSEKAEKEIRDYMQTFPMVFDYLTQNQAQDAQAIDLFPTDTEKNIAELTKWLKERDSATIERRPCGSQVLEEEVVMALEKYIDSHFNRGMKKRIVPVNSKPSQLYLPKPKIGQAVDPQANYQLFDRIVNVRESHTVPFGAKGTIIGIHHEELGPKALYDILFDKEFTGGLKLRSSPHRGYRLPAQVFIDISFGLDGGAHRTPGKPTAVVVPSSGINEEFKMWNNVGHNSAFASWRNKLYQEENTAVQEMVQTRPRPRQDNHHFSHINNFPSNRVSVKTKGQLVMPSNTLIEDSSVALKKILKISDEADRKPTVHLNSRSPMKVSNVNTASIPSTVPYSMQLLSLHQQQGKVPRYLFTDLKDGTMVATVSCYNGKEYQGTACYNNTEATETAAHVAVQRLAFDDSMVPSQVFRRPFTTGLPCPPIHENWREPTKPSNLPHPPTNWYQTHHAVPNFMPGWMGNSGFLRQSHLNFMPPPSQFHIAPHTAYHPLPFPFPQYAQMLPGRMQRIPFMSVQEMRPQTQIPPPGPRPLDTPITTASTEIKVQTEVQRQTMGNGSTNSNRRMPRPKSRIAAKFSEQMIFD